MIYLEVGLILALILGLMWLFGSSVEKLASLMIGIVVLIIIGIILGIGVQISYIIFPIAGG